jgi:hypothetical protein
VGSCSFFLAVALCLFPDKRIVSLVFRTTFSKERSDEASMGSDRVGSGGDHVDPAKAVLSWISNSELARIELQRDESDRREAIVLQF